MKRNQIRHEIVFEDKAFAAKYARRHQKMGQKLGYEYAKLLRRRGFQNGRIIDVGCGSGASAIVLADQFPRCQVVGIDLSEPLLEIARQSARIKHLESRVRFEKADVQQIPFADASFDGVISANMAHIVTDPVRMLNEIERILKPDGILYVVDLKRSSLAILEPEIRSSLTLAEAKALFRQSNLRSGTFSAGLIWWRFET